MTQTNLELIESTAKYLDEALEEERKELIDKACEWLQEHKNDYAFPIYQGEELTDESYVSDDIIKDLRKAMEE